MKEAALEAEAKSEAYDFLRSWKRSQFLQNIVIPLLLLVKANIVGGGVAGNKMFGSFFV